MAERFPATPDPVARAKAPKQVSGAIAAKLAQVIPLPEREPEGSAFDRACREKLARFEQAPR